MFAYPPELENWAATYAISGVERIKYRTYLDSIILGQRKRQLLLHLTDKDFLSLL